MTAKILQMPEAKSRLHCTTCHEEGFAPCNCQGTTFISTAKARVQRKQDAHARYRNGETQEQIAGVWKVTQDTIKRDLADFDLTTVVNSKRPKTATNPRGAGRKKGSDGKRKPTGSKRAKIMPKLDEAVRIIRPLFDAGTPFSEKTLLKEHGISHGTLAAAVAYLKGHREATSDPIIDPATLSMTAQQKLAAGERQMRRGLEAEYAARLLGLDEEVRQKVLTRNQEYLATLNKMEEEAAETKRTYREFMDRQKKIFTKDEYRLVVMCVHADASISDEKRNEATRMLIAKRFALTGEK